MKIFNVSQTILEYAYGNIIQFIFRTNIPVFLIRILICTTVVLIRDVIGTTIMRIRILRPNKNISVVRVTCQKKLGRVGREKKFFQDFFLYRKMYTYSPTSQFFSPVTHLSAVLN